MASRKRTKPEIVHLTQLHVESINDGEIDFVLQDAFGVDKTDRNYQYINFIEKGDTPECNNYPVSIDYLLEKLTALKEKGCNYVALDFHDDHIAYEISGFAITHSTPEEIAVEEAEQARMDDAKKRMDALVEQARAIGKEHGLIRF